VCGSDYKNCAYCNQNNNKCENGCFSNDNCDGYTCNSNHTCSTGVSSIQLDTFTCNGCQGAQGKSEEDGPFVILIGANFGSCNTRQLDHPNKIDFDNGKTSEFSEESMLQSCYKKDLSSEIIGGSIHWTASQGEWKPKDGLIQMNWNTGESDCCCLGQPSISPANQIGSFKKCTRCAVHPGC